MTRELKIYSEAGSIIDEAATSIGMIRTSDWRWEWCVDDLLVVEMEFRRTRASSPTDMAVGLDWCYGFTAGGSVSGEFWQISSYSMLFFCGCSEVGAWRINDGELRGTIYRSGTVVEDVAAGWAALDRYAQCIRDKFRSFLEAHGTGRTALDVLKNRDLFASWIPATSPPLVHRHFDTEIEARLRLMAEG